MKQYILVFLRRGLAAMGFGPMVLAVLYLLLPVPIRAFITKEMIGDIIQGVFDAMADYATTQLDKALSDKEG